MDFPKRLLALDNQAIMEFVADFKANNGVGKNVHFRQTRVFLSQQKVAYIKKLSSILGDKVAKESSTNAIFRCFKETCTS